MTGRDSKYGRTLPIAGVESSIAWSGFIARSLHVQARKLGTSAFRRESLWLFSGP